MHRPVGGVSFGEEERGFQLVVVVDGGGGVWLSVGRGEGDAIVVGVQQGFQYVIIVVTIIVIVSVFITDIVFKGIIHVTHRG